jgi:hypothetical protein
MATLSQHRISQNEMHFMRMRCTHCDIKRLISGTIDDYLCLFIMYPYLLSYQLLYCTLSVVYSEKIYHK